MAERGVSMARTLDVDASRGTVRVTRRVRASAVDVWRALTDPAAVRRWFGELTPSLRSGVDARLDFGDGDFFELTDVELHVLTSVQYAWRFLGTGPRDTIVWHIVPRGASCEVTVTDSEAERSPETSRALTKGWQDFTARLVRFLTRGESARYAWRQEFDGSIELSRPLEAAWTALVPAGVPAWLPFRGTAWREGVALEVTDGETPAVFELGRLLVRSPTQLEFQLRCRDWLRPTTCRVEVSERREGTMLTVSHVGWPRITAHEDEQRRQRHRFAALWVAALHAARRLVG